MGAQITKYYGEVGAEVIIGANVHKDFLAGLPDVFGGGTPVSYDKVMQQGCKSALQGLKACAAEKGGDAVDINFNYQVLGQSNSMIMVSATGTAVIIELTVVERLA